jgi:hypothetical protein
MGRQNIMVRQLLTFWHPGKREWTAWVVFLLSFLFQPCTQPTGEHCCPHSGQVSHLTFCPTCPFVPENTLADTPREVCFPNILGNFLSNQIGSQVKHLWTSRPSQICWCLDLGHFSIHNNFEKWVSIVYKPHSGFTACHRSSNRQSHSLIAMGPWFLLPLVEKPLK